MNAVLRSVLFIAVICALIFIACSFGKKASYKNVGTDEFERLIADKAVQILDSRSKAEYDEGHIEGAILIDVNDSSFKAKAGATLSKDKPVAVYCRSGRRSRSWSRSRSGGRGERRGLRRQFIGANRRHLNIISHLQHLL